MTISVTLSSAFAMVRQVSTTTRRYGSVAVQPLVSDSDLTSDGCFAASHMPVAAPSDRPKTCALEMPAARMNSAMSSANSSVV
jgi:hypothetical protein